jgi:hypothetical protein
MVSLYLAPILLLTKKVMAYFTQFIP